MNVSVILQLEFFSHVQESLTGMSRMQIVILSVKKPPGFSCPYSLSLRRCTVRHAEKLLSSSHHVRVAWTFFLKAHNLNLSFKPALYLAVYLNR